MAQVNRKQPCPNVTLDRTEEIQRQIQQLSGRDLQLWSIAILVLLVLASGLIALVLPNLVWKPHILRIEQNYLPQLFFGLISLIVLFNIYLLSQKHTLNVTRRALIRELVLSERFENLSLVDPLTQLLNRRAVEHLLPREISRSNRTATDLTFCMLDITGLAAINSRLGDEAGDELLLEFSKLMKSVFRGGDLLFRYAGDQFLVVMPETSEPLAEHPMQRLATAIENWNLASGKNYEMAFTWASATYVTGTELGDALRTAERKIRQKKHSLTPVF
jgi:diguanylate cyclase (GGDEF)-like protein